MSTRGQKNLRRLYKAQNIIGRIALEIFYIFTFTFLLAALYYGVCLLMGKDVGNRFTLYGGSFLIFAAGLGAIKLFETALSRMYQKDYEFEPSRMELPAAGTVTLENALHKMAINTGVIGWDTIFGVLLLSLFSMMLTLGGNVPLILLICLILAVLLAVGHVFFTWRWKQRRFTDRIIGNTKSFIPMSSPQEYAGKVEESLLGGVLYYAREMVLTKDFIIGIIKTDVQFYPVAIPRTKIEQLIFYCRRPVMNHYRRNDMGILKCILKNGSTVELLIGQAARMERVLKVLDYYGIRWKEEETVYE